MFSQENGMHCNTFCGLTAVEDVRLPYIVRDNQSFVPVRILEAKVLSKYPNASGLAVNNPIPSYFVSEIEAKTLTCLGDEEVFTTQDLVVGLAGFLTLLEDIKRLCLPPVDGGWVQINNTVIPFVVKDDSKMVALSIVQCAAGLLVGREVPTVYPNEAECAFLNDRCKDAGIEFQFVTDTQLVELVLLACYCDVRPLIKLLPNGNPFAMAQYQTECLGNEQTPVICDENVTIERTNAPSSLLTSDSSFNSNIVVANDTGNDSALKQILLAPAMKAMEPVKDCLNPVSVNILPAYCDALNTVNSNQTLCNSTSTSRIPSSVVMLDSYPVPSAKPNVGGTKTQKSSRKRQRSAKNRVETETTSFSNNRLPVIEEVRSLSTTSYSHNSSQFLPSSVTREELPETATDEEKQLQLLQLQSQLNVAVASDIVAGEHVWLRRVHCFGKTISCMVKGNKLYMLLEAMNRLYFPMCPLDAVIETIEDLPMKIEELTHEEEKDFLKFYKLPTEKLNCNKIINIMDFIAGYGLLNSVLNSSVTFISEDDIRAGCVLIRHVRCMGTTFLCVVINDVMLVAIEEIRSAYFGWCDTEAILKACAELGLPVSRLSAEEEANFIKFFRSSISSPVAFVNINDFIRNFATLHGLLSAIAYMSHASKVHLLNQSPVAGFGVAHPSVSTHALENLIDSSSYVYSAGKAGVQHVAPNLLDSHCANTGGTVPSFGDKGIQPNVGNIDSTYTRNDQIKPKRQRTRVIGEIICIDD